MIIPLHLLGISGVTVSRPALGSMLFGASMDEGESLWFIGHSTEFGLNLLDTADSYGVSRSEEIVGRATAGKRDRRVLATKIGSQTA